MLVEGRKGSAGRKRVRGRAPWRTRSPLERESQCAARRASCRTSWFYPRWATMNPDTTTTVPSLTGRPPTIVNIPLKWIASACAWWVSTAYFALVLHFRQHQTHSMSKKNLLLFFLFTPLRFLYLVVAYHLPPPCVSLCVLHVDMKNAIFRTEVSKRVGEWSEQRCGVAFRVRDYNASDVSDRRA